ncbi:Fgf-Sk1 protein precursor [Saccoglossus kowalevskii]|uniref:Fibroblast growth factor n=1 Tax=Saccoglossus kowalevskii TaxID=10224 RepID=D1LX10_SACKO|nr:Fgf-Sk1 protein precursor [Saccoglossus kowalevskii]ACY92516.1 Fgf-Sk1 protein [Saccoglossus kowalevskii]
MRITVSGCRFLGLLVVLMHFVRESCTLPASLSTNPIGGGRMQTENTANGDVRSSTTMLLNLYCDTGTSLIIYANDISSTNQRENQLAILEKQSVGVGLVSIQGVISRHFLAMDDTGTIYPSSTFNEDCRFRESYRNGYYFYSSARDPTWFISIDRNGQVKRSLGNSRKRTHFLPLLTLPVARPI